jgi:hypothetical protein
MEEKKRAKIAEKQRELLEDYNLNEKLKKDYIEY